MAAFRHGSLFIPTFSQVRHKRVNIQKPKVDRLPRRLFEALVKPVFKPKGLKPADICAVKTMQLLQQTKEVNPYEEFLFRRCLEMFETRKMIAVCQSLPSSAEQFKAIRNQLINNGMNLVHFNNNLMRRAVTDSKYVNMLPLFIGHNYYIVSDDIQIKEMVKVTKKTPQLHLIGALIDNRILTRDELMSIAKLPDIEQLHGELLTILGRSASKTYSLLGSHQQTLSVNLEQLVKQKQTDSESHVKKS
ncbi:hypothetical protein SNE40_004276 [Patella caerulea]|uniref:Large ribosomal subunit protein uL10m n=1 Tax=Patella caerulea TaxID=87958 RepID=A0AAN8KIL0_PATCE